MQCPKWPTNVLFTISIANYTYCEYLKIANYICKTLMFICVSSLLCTWSSFLAGIGHCQIAYNVLSNFLSYRLGRSLCTFNVMGLYLAYKMETLSQFVIYIFKNYLFIYFCIFRAAPAAYGSSNARGQIGAVVAGLRCSHSNARYEPHLRPTPQLTAMLDS